MLKQIFPKSYPRYIESPVAYWLQHFSEWLVAEGYAHDPTQGHVRRLKQALERTTSPKPPDLSFRSEEIATLFADLGQPVLFQATEQAFRRFLYSQKRLIDDKKLSPFDELLCAYRAHLDELRGLSETTIGQHLSTISRFLIDVLPSEAPLNTLSAKAVEAFVITTSQRVTRQTLQHVVAHLRSFLRFCYDQNVLSNRLDTIDTPPNL